MRILMLGWEFPPYISGGLGTACEGLTRGLSQRGAEIAFVLPRPIAETGGVAVRTITPHQVRTSAQQRAEAKALAQTNGHQASTATASDPGAKISFHVVPSTLPTPYNAIDPTDPVAVASAALERSRPARSSSASEPAPAGTTTYESAATTDIAHEAPATAHYTGDLFAEAQRYAELCVEVARHETFDVIHAHDWLTFPAAMAVAAATGKPFIAHVHSTEFDRAGEGFLHSHIFEIERRGMHAATRVIAVSHLTKRILESRYSLDPAKIDVIYNAIDNGHPVRVDPALAKIRSTDRIVLFLGRITMQKGPEYFIDAARKVLDVMEGVKFIMAGSGDQAAAIMEQAAQAGIGGKVLFTGFLRGADVHRVFEIADVYVMPSVSEPFGIAALEAISHDVPVIISKQSGVSEVVSHALKVDFWDTDEMANKIIAVLRHAPLADTLREEADMEIRGLTWTGAADKCLTSYDRAVRAMPV